MEKEMKCVFCGGNAKTGFEDISLHEGKIILKSQPYFKCIECGKEFVSRKQMIESEFNALKPIV